MLALRLHWLARHLLTVTCLALASGCAGSTEAASPPASPQAQGWEQQKIIDRSAAAIRSMRSSGRFEAMEYFLRSAKAVMIFPRVIKAALVFGGEGGNGVLVARGADGRWSAPAFYSLGAGSVGFQLGYQQATVVLFFMNEAALMSAIDKGLTLGADASVAAGTVGDAGEAVATSTSSDVYYFVEVGGVFAGASLDGTVLADRDAFNERYYGPGASTMAIVVRREQDRPGTAALRDALAP